MTTIIALSTFSNGTDTYVAGQIYEAADDKAAEMISSGVAREVETSRLANYTEIEDVVAGDVGENYVEGSVGKAKEIKEYTAKDGLLLKTTTFTYPTASKRTIEVVRA